MEKDSLLEINKKLDILKSQCKPTDTWQTYLDEDDEMGNFYTQEGIDEVSNALDQFINGLMNRDNYRNSNSIEEIIYKVVINLNDISRKYEGMIETNEREELVEFIHSAIDIIGYDFIGDVTEKWRDW